MSEQHARGSLHRGTCLFALCLLMAVGSSGAAPTGERASERYTMGRALRFEPELEPATSILFSNGLSVDTRTGASNVPVGLRADASAPGPRLSIIQFTGPLERDWRRRLEREGIATFGYLAPYATLAVLDHRQQAEAVSLPFVRWAGPFHPGYKLQEHLLNARGWLELDLLLTPFGDEGTVRGRIAELGGDVKHVTHSGFGTVVRFFLDVDRFGQLAALDDILWVQQWTEPEICNNSVQWVTQTGWSSSAPPDTSTLARNVWRQGVRGRGLILSTTDTGLNTGHDQFRDPDLPVTPPGIWPGHRKVVAFKLYAGADAGESPTHGTHVTNTVGGCDSVTGGTSYYDGAAKDARVYFVDVSASGGGFVIGSDLTALWDTVYLGRGLPDSVRPIVQHSGSWGWSNSSGTYLLMDASTDAYCWANKDFLNIMAAGNESSALCLRNPGIAKSVLTVGATGRGTASNTIAGFSSRGPTQDGRVKPNIVAPGVDLWSARPSPATNTYQQMSGTSMATPAANGAIGLIRQYLRDGYYPTGSPEPGDRRSYISSALMRAMAMVSSDPNVGSFTVPDSNIGWGRVDIDSVLYFPGQARRLLLKDDTAGVATGEFKEQQFRVTASIPLRAMLAWTDTAAAPNANPTLVNNLNLELLSPSGTQYRGNQFSGGQSVANPSNWDNRNVEEGFRVNAPDTGIWTLRVYGQNVATSARQPFAWVVTGGFETASSGDVGVSRIIAPTSQVDSGTVVTPACSVYNYGSTTVSYSVRMRIGAGYNDAVAVANHLPGTRRYVTFPNWIAQPGGSQAVNCSTELALDAEPSNDRQTGSVLVARFDAAAVSITSPAGTFDSTGTRTVQARVRNNGNTTVTFPVLFRITGATTWSDTVIVSNLAPGSEVAVGFANWPVGPRGSYTAICSTRLAGDGNSGNNRVTGNFTVRVRDAAAIGLESPGAAVDSGTSVPVRAVIANYGSVESQVGVRVTIGSSYSQQQLVTLPAGSVDTVSLTNWQANVSRGSVATRCSVWTTGDLDPSNDVVPGQVLVRVRDVGVTEIIAPTGTCDSGVTIAPRARVRNQGNTDETFAVRFDIADGYVDMRNVTLQSGRDTVMTFADWVAATPGLFEVKCSTRLAGDRYQSNDRRTGTINVAGTDVGIVSILAPGSAIHAGPVQPSVRWRNYSPAARDFRTWVTITDSVGVLSYADSAQVVALPADSSVDLTFAEWTATPGSWTMRCSTWCNGDLNPGNDTARRRVLVYRSDVGMEAIVSPTGTIRPVPVSPVARFANYGDLTETISGFLFIEDTVSGAVVYFDSVRVSGVGPGQRVTRSFPGWQPTFGYYRLTGWTEHAGDIDPSNDTARASVRCTPGALGWALRVDVPRGAVPVRQGAGLAPMETGDTRLFCLKGNKTSEFYSYSTESYAWTTLPPIPTGPSGRPVGKGGVMCSDNTRYVYALKGNRTEEFWRYDAVEQAWHQLASLPFGARRLADGSGLAFIAVGDSDFVYCLKGSKTHEFYRYSVAGNTWAAMPDAPGLSSGRGYVKGSALAAGADGLYALRGRFNEFNRFDPVQERWFGCAGFPEYNVTGRRNRAKDGAALTGDRQGTLYAFAGGNRQSFFVYAESLNCWGERESLPHGPSRRRVKSGAALSFAAREVWALKGNKTNEFWVYTPDTMTLFLLRPGRSGVMASPGDRLATGLLVGPNPARSEISLFAGSIAGPAQVELVSVLGTVLAERTLMPRTPMRIPVGHLPAGSYFIRVRDGDAVVTRKVVIGR